MQIEDFWQFVPVPELELLVVPDVPPEEVVPDVPPEEVLPDVPPEELVVLPSPVLSLLHPAETRAMPATATAIIVEWRMFMGGWYRARRGNAPPTSVDRCRRRA